MGWVCVVGISILWGKWMVRDNTIGCNVAAADPLKAPQIVFVTATITSSLRTLAADYMQDSYRVAQPPLYVEAVLTA